MDEEIIFVINEEHTALLGLLLSTDGLSDTNEEPCLDLNFMFKLQRILKKKSHFFPYIVKYLVTQLMVSYQTGLVEDLASNRVYF